jgi:delta(3,5)-delta(2,4)-dienoyl-CoA isomerase
VAVVEINRAKKLNSFTAQMFEDLGSIFKQLSVSSDVRAIILTGAGERAFTAGLDINAASQGALAGDGIKGTEEKDTARKAWDLRRHIKDLQGPVSYVETCEKPVICVSK